MNWNEEDDEWHKVTDDNKALYGVLTADNISTYADRIVYLPKIDTSGITDMTNMFSDCCSLVAIPMLDTSNVEIMRNTFRSCFSLTTIPLLDISNVTEMDNMFQNCYALKSIPMLDTSNADSIYQMFQFCYALNSIHMLDASKETSLTRLFDGCTSLVHVNIKNVKLAYDLGTATLLTKDSLLYLINNEAAESVITIKLASYAYDKWATDPDIVAALANHLNITLAM